MVQFEEGVGFDSFMIPLFIIVGGLAIYGVWLLFPLYAIPGANAVLAFVWAAVGLVAFPYWIVIVVCEVFIILGSTHDYGFAPGAILAWMPLDGKEVTPEK